MPGHTGDSDMGRTRIVTASMEGRTIARPYLPGLGVHRTSHLRFNGGPDNCPAIPSPTATAYAAAIQPSMEGRTIARPYSMPDRDTARRRNPPSMEGRTIARPYGDRLAAHDRGRNPGFNGGPDNCPAIPAPPAADRSASSGFNGGPDNCPAILPGRGAVRVATPSLQWRAGQLPGHTGTTPTARPARRDMLQWRAGQLPGHTDVGHHTEDVDDQADLQWRAGQLPGHTMALSAGRDATGCCFNGGPDNCPAIPVRGS